MSRNASLVTAAAAVVLGACAAVVGADFPEPLLMQAESGPVGDSDAADGASLDGSGAPEGDLRGPW